MMTGLDWSFGRNVQVGGVFGYGNPRLNNRFGTVEADDFTLGMYLNSRRLLRSVPRLQMNSFIGWGKQNYEMRRWDAAGYHASKFGGDAIYANVEFYTNIESRRLGHRITPLIALDYQRASLNGFTETGSQYGQTIAGSHLDRLVLRTGVNAEFGKFTGHLQYGYLVGGDEYGVVNTSFTGANGVMSLQGVNLGRNQLDMGIGWSGKLGGRAQLFADYDYYLGDRSGAHQGQLGVSTKW